MGASGNEVTKSYRSLAVSEGLLGKVVEAIKVGEADARRSGKVTSFEVFLRGHRTNIVIGQLVIVPAKVADTPEDFPVTLLNGAMVRELSPEAIADLMTYKLGTDSDAYDEMKNADLSEIKDKLFKDADGKYRSIIVFIPSWGTPRNYVIFKMTKDEAHLIMLVRHQIFAAYYDPAMSSAFEQLSTDLATDQVDVTDITPKFLYPNLVHGLLQQYPDLQIPESADVKTASQRRPKMHLAADTVQDALEDLLEPGEREVLDALTDDLKKNVDDTPVDGDDFVKSAAEGQLTDPDGIIEPLNNVFGRLNDVMRLRLKNVLLNPTPVTWENARSIIISDKPTKTLWQAVVGVDPTYPTTGPKHGQDWQIPSRETLVAAVKSVAPVKHSTEFTPEDIAFLKDMKIQAAKDAKKPATGLRRQPDYGAADSHTVKQNELAAKDASVKEATTKKAGPNTNYEWTMAEDNGQWHWTIFRVGAFGKDKPVGQGTASSRELAQQHRVEKLAELQGRDQEQYPQTGLHAAPSMPVRAAAKKADTVRLKNEVEILKSDGASLYQSDNERTPEKPLFVAQSSDGKLQQVVFDGARVVYENPDKFPPSFRIAVERYFKNPKKASRRVQSRLLSQQYKRADVPMTFEEIWSDMTEELGEPPAIELSGNDGSKAPAEKSEPAAEKSPEKKENVAEKKDEPNDENVKPKGEAPSKREEDDKKEAVKPKADDKPEIAKAEEKKPEEKKPEEKKEAAAAPKSHKFKAQRGKGCLVCNKLPDDPIHQGGKTASKKCGVCGKSINEAGKGWSETSPDHFTHDACVSHVKEANANSLVVTPILARHYPEVLKAARAESVKKLGFDLFSPNQVLESVRPELLGEIVNNPEQTNSPMIQDIGPESMSPASTSPGQVGIGNNGQSQVMEGIPLRQEGDIRGFGFNDEFHQQYEMLEPGSLTRAASAVTPLSKRAADVEFRLQFEDFLKKVVGEIAATFIAAFKVTSRPVMNKVPGVGEVQLAQVEQPQNLSVFNIVNTGSRVKWLLSKLNDSDIKDAINASFAQAAVWSEAPNGGFNYEVFVRPSALDTDTMILSYEYVCGTKGL